ncbi:iap-3 [Spodoptera frugiperda granulovirus]|uniref:Iap-3 n=1 Tax=Spodoptera frugiperda granulovirus TaxID=307454 RepID=A0A0C5B386_9BBAC|nr:iap-3 [Spodoptera frugiperda granulovirus]AJK91775.1 iap-3 [Spodoptera frugiperda granulovirus]
MCLFYLVMKSYDQRLLTYTDVWTYDDDVRLRPERLALLGFYYTGVDDKIKCAYCELCLSRFKCGSIFFDPLVDHKRWSPECTFIYENLQKPTVYVNTRPPVVVDLATMENRLNTFRNNWPVVLQHLCFDMCLAGLYYTGAGDVVACYLCAVRIGEWWPQHVPWIRHHHQNPACPYIAINYNKIDLMAGVTTVAPDNNAPLVTTTQTYDKPDSSAPELQIIQHENSWRLPQCVVCRSGFISCVLTPCFDLCVCDKCSSATVECPVCQRYVSGAFRVNIPVRQLSTVHITD